MAWQPRGLHSPDPAGLDSVLARHVRAWVPEAPLRACGEQGSRAVVGVRGKLRPGRGGKALGQRGGAPGTAWKFPSPAFLRLGRWDQSTLEDAKTYRNGGSTLSSHTLYHPLQSGDTPFPVN